MQRRKQHGYSCASSGWGRTGASGRPIDLHVLVRCGPWRASEGHACRLGELQLKRKRAGCMGCNVEKKVSQIVFFLFRQCLFGTLGVSSYSVFQQRLVEFDSLLRYVPGLSYSIPIASFLALQMKLRGQTTGKKKWTVYLSSVQQNHAPDFLRCCSRQIKISLSLASPLFFNYKGCS